jgi:hypothetical protein
MGPGSQDKLDELRIFYLLPNCRIDILGFLRSLRAQ